MKHINLKANSFGRDFVLADVNGCLKELQKLISAVNFNENDRLFLLGNLINKGLYSKEVVEFTRAKNIFPVLGDAEVLLLTAMSKDLPPLLIEDLNVQWDEVGGSWRYELSQVELESIRNLIARWPLSITVDAHKKIGLVHSECPFDDWHEFQKAEIDYSLLMKSVSGQTVLQGSRDGEIQNIDAVVSGHIQLARPPVSVGKCSFINHGIVIGRKSRLYQLDEF